MPSKGKIFNSFGSYVHSEYLEPLVLDLICIYSYRNIQIEQYDTVSNPQINLIGTTCNYCTPVELVLCCCSVAL